MDDKTFIIVILILAAAAFVGFVIGAMAGDSVKETIGGFITKKPENITYVNGTWSKPEQQDPDKKNSRSSIATR